MSTARPASGWVPVIGLEVHVQLRTASKMFCRCEARFGAPPNTLICPTCSGQPGTLPVLNAEALRLGVLAGLALGCTMDPVTKFDRKNYFYPDLPKGYQISQFDMPLCRDGQFRFCSEDGTPHEVTIVRAHLEEDSGKIIHPDGMDISLIDLNRAGTPLLEIVSGPDMRSAAEAMAYLQGLRRTLRYAGVADCDMEKGGFRCDVNISLRRSEDAPLGTRTETKNLNSFRFVAGALEAEIARQAERLDGGGEVLQQTMAYDPESGRTRAMRTKEDAHDYRYFPEPDLPTFRVDEAWVAGLAETLPELPGARELRFREELGLPATDVEQLVAEKNLGDYFETALALTGRPKDTANWLLTEVLRLSNDRKRSLDELAVTPERMADLVNLVASGSLSVQAGRTLATAMEDQPDRTAAELAAELDLTQVSDDDELTRLVEGVLAAEGELVERYRAGNASLLNALLGSAMKVSRGKANPKTVRQLLEKALGPAG
jgi:aspartyl-tRNA(Asn)/glutamyl-tRNA(Gln) amidotransferase subunit B